MREFGLIRDIVPDRPETWSEKIFLTFDIDWASDEVLALTLDIVERYCIAATWFLTHETPLLARIRANPCFEQGLHPNFNSLLIEGAHPKGWNAKQIVEDNCRLAPDARSIRSHSLTQSSRLTPLFSAVGITHDCNTYVPWQTAIALRPWVDWTGLIKVPYFWSDDLYAMLEEPVSPGALLSSPGLKIFGFHPIHIALNSVNLTVYEETRPIHNRLDLLQAHKMEGLGAEKFLLRLIETAIS